tara:strand:+ start:1901 stop:2605 length:705 start_codon:yes stop_codon:yes gene_type:complete
MNLNNEKFVMVLGSKPNSTFPDLQVEKIYAANGASERANFYKKKYPNALLLSLIASREFEKNLDVQKRVIEANPDQVISRSGWINFEKYNFSEKTKFKYFTPFKQFIFQSKFFKFHFIDILVKETFYEEKIYDKFSHFFRSLKNCEINGVSTGFFAILYALEKNENYNIIISGIGMSGGGHYYNKDTSRYQKRSNVDKALLKSLKKKFKDRLFTIDNELYENTGINYIDLKTFT